MLIQFYYESFGAIIHLFIKTSTVLNYSYFRLVAADTVQLLSILAELSFHRNSLPDQFRPVYSNNSI